MQGALVQSELACVGIDSLALTVLSRACLLSLSGEVCSKPHSGKGLVKAGRKPSFSRGEEETPPP